MIMIRKPKPKCKCGEEMFLSTMRVYRPIRRMATVWRCKCGEWRFPTYKKGVNDKI